MLAHEPLLRSSDARPDSGLVCDHGTWRTYSDVLEGAQRLACYLLLELRLSRGSRVVLYWENGFDALVVSFGVWIAGCVLVPLNTELKGANLRDLVMHSDAEVAIASRKQATRLITAMDGVPSIRLILEESSTRSWNEIVDTGSAPHLTLRTIDLDLAAIIYTSGSTGKPKGVMLTHLNLISNTRSIASYLHLTSADRIMMILPHFYIYGLSLVLTHVLVGGSIVIDNRFMYPNTVLETMAKTEATGFAGVPSTFSILLSRSAVRQMSFPALRYVTQAGGAMPPAIQQDVARVFHPAKLFIMYGATEAAPRLTYLDPEDLPRKWGSIGKAVDNVDVFVADQDGKRLPPGQEGEIVARGSNITPGYWKDPEASAQVLRKGLYFTGDFGVEDEEGFLYVTGRSKNIIKVKGFRVSPREIEEELIKIDGVSEAAVIGVEDPVLGEAPVAFYVPSDHTNLSAGEMKKQLSTVLAPYKIPICFYAEPELPLSAAGKVQASKLRELYAQRTEGNVEQSNH